MDYRSISLDILREAAREASTLSSVRALAITLRVGRTTLQNFIHRDTHPHPRVLRRVAEWYLVQIQPSEPGSGEEFDTALRVLLRDLAPQHVHTARSAILTLLVTLYRVTGSPVPAPLDALRVHGSVDSDSSGTISSP
jgi:hypothetical protein